MLYVVRGDQSLRFVPSVWRTTDDDDGDDDIILRCVLMYCMYTFFLRKNRCCCCCCRHRCRSSQQHSRVQDQTTCSRPIRIELRKCECAGCATVCVRLLLRVCMCVYFAHSKCRVSLSLSYSSWSWLIVYTAYLQPRRVRSWTRRDQSQNDNIGIWKIHACKCKSPSIIPKCGSSGSQRFYLIMSVVQQLIDAPAKHAQDKAKKVTFVIGNYDCCHCCCCLCRPLFQFSFSSTLRSMRNKIRFQ